jgi:hypothetical protein
MTVRDPDMPGHVPHFADASTTRHAGQSGERVKLGGAGGDGFEGCFSLLKESKAWGRDPDNFAPVEIFLRDETSILGIIPNRQPGAEGTPNISCFLVAPLAAGQSFQQIEDPCVDNRVSPRSFLVHCCYDDRVAVKVQRAAETGESARKPYVGGKQFEI